MLLDVWCDLQKEQQLLRAELAAAGDTHDRTAWLLYELGRVTLAQNQPMDAARHLLRSYALSPSFLPTIRLARQIYWRRGDSSVLARLFAAEERATQDHLARAHLLQQRGRVLWHANEKAAAIECFQAAIKLDSAEFGAVKQLDILLVQADSLPAKTAETRARLWTQQQEIIADESIRAAILTDLALLHATCDNTELALQTIATARKLDPKNTSIALVNDQLIEASGDYAGLAASLVTQAEASSGDTRRAATLWAHAARIQWRHCNDPLKAAEFFSRAMEQEPELGVASDRYHILRTHGQLAAAVDAGEELFDLVTTPALRAALACEIGDYCRIDLKDTARASDWYHRCLLHVAAYQPALEGLAGLLEATGDFDALLSIHQHELKSAHQPEARARRLFRIGTLLEQHGRDTQATEMHKQALATQPGFLPSSLALERLLKRNEEWEALLRLYEQQLEETADRERIAYVLETMALILYQHIGDTARAIDCVYRLVDLCPNHLQGLGLGARLCAEQHRWQEHVNLRKREIDVISDKQRKAELLEQTGEALEYHLFDLDGAISCYQTALQHHPGFLPALRALGRLYRQKGRWKDLISMHRAEVQQCRDAQQTLSLLCTIAEIHEEELLDADAAAATYQEIVAKNPAYVPAIEALARNLERKSNWEALANLLESTLDAFADPHDQAIRLWRLGMLRWQRQNDPKGAIRELLRAARLAPDLLAVRASLTWLLEETGQVGALAEFLKKDIERLSSPKARAPLERRVAELHARPNGDTDRAAALYQASYMAEPTAATAWELARIYRDTGNFSELTRMLERLSETTQDERSAAEIQLEIAQIKHATSIGDPVPHYVAAASVGVGRLVARRYIESALRATPNDKRLVDTLVVRAEGETEPLELACIWHEIAEVQLRCNDTTAAEHAFRRALTAWPSHPEALMGLGELLDEQQRWHEHVEAVERATVGSRLGASYSTELVSAAAIAEQRLSDPKRALELYKVAFTADPLCDNAYQRCYALVQQQEDWNALAALMRTRISATHDDTAMAAQFFQLGTLYLEKLGQQRKGEACLRRVIELEPGNVVALTALGDIYIEREDWPKAEAVLVLAEQASSEDANLAGILRRLGIVHLRANRPKAALADFLRTAKLTQGWRNLWLVRQIAHAAEAAEDYPHLAQAFETLAEIEETPTRQIEARRRAAFLLDEHCDDSGRSTEALQKLLIADPLDITAIERLAAAIGRTGNTSALGQHLQAAVAHHRAAIAQRPLSVDLYKQLARIFRWKRQFDALYCTCSVIAHFEALDDTDRIFFEQYQGHERVPNLLGRAELYEQVIVPSAMRGPLRDLIKLIEPEILQLATQSPAKIGLRRSDYAPEHPFIMQAYACAELVNHPHFSLWVNANDPQMITPHILVDPALIIGTTVAEGALSATERTRLGRALAQLAEPIQFVAQRANRDIPTTIYALVCALATEAKAQLPNIDLHRDTEFESTIKRAVARKTRRALRTQFAEIASWLSLDSIVAYSRGINEIASRAALLLAGDPWTCLQTRSQSSPQLSAEELGSLCQFIVSDLHFALRRELGTEIRASDRKDSDVNRS